MMGAVLQWKTTIHCQGGARFRYYYMIGVMYDRDNVDDLTAQQRSGSENTQQIS